jgi:MoaA/NifB/PqqE/SkfB family radical SAM enzyme
MKKKGLTGAVISLDHWEESRHNTFRKNKNSYQWVMEAVKNCKEAGIIVCLSLCPTKEFVNEDNLNRYHQLAKDLGVAFVRILEPRPVGRFSNKDILLEPGQIKIIDTFAVTRNTDSGYRTYPIIQFPGHHQRKTGCLGAGNRYIYIDSNGDFHACPFCRKPLGNALSESIETGIFRARTMGCHMFESQTIN